MNEVLNLGCGFKHMIGVVNVDAFDICQPDVVWDLNEVPWPWEENSIDKIYMHHVLEHLTNWWEAFEECGRVLKVGGIVEISVPDASSDSALAYRDHHQIFTPFTFHGAHDFKGEPFRHGTNAWARMVSGSVPLKIINYEQKPFKHYNWMIRWAPWLLRFCANHLRNFIWEQVFVFERIEGGKDV